MEQRRQQQQQQRGVCSFSPDRTTCCGAGASSCPPAMRLSITSTTGHPVELSVHRGETVEGLRVHISNKLRMQTDRIVLLYKDRQLTTGKLLDLGVTDGSKLTLVPVVESGLASSTARAERSMMDVLGNLTEAQISDFLSGRSALTLNLGIGGHVMYVQLQLSAQNVAELQQLREYKDGIHGQNQTGVPAAARLSHRDFAPTLCSYNTTGTTSSPASQKWTHAPGSSAPPPRFQVNRPRARTSLNSTAPSSHPEGISPPLPTRKPSPLTSPQSLPPECPRPSSPLPAAAPACSPAAPAGSDPGPPSPAPATTFRESSSAPPAEPCQPPGAHIESFVSHSPGVFSGTFSGTLAPCSQSSTTHPRSGVSIILQILNDLLRAAFHHQRASPSAPHMHGPASYHSHSASVSAEEQRAAASQTQEPQKTGKTPGEENLPRQSATPENQALHCKLERLQVLMQQRQSRRRSRRNSHLSQTSRPYQHSRHRP